MPISQSHNSILSLAYICKYWTKTFKTNQTIPTIIQNLIKINDYSTNAERKFAKELVSLDQNKSKNT